MKLKNELKTQKMTRMELYNLIWSTPMTTLAKKYLMSDSGLRKICKRMNIPLPKAGHWKKLEVGKQVIIEELPPSYTGKEDLELTLRQEGDNSKAGPPSEFMLLQKEIENDPTISLEVPRKLSNPDELIIQAKKEFEEHLTKKYFSNGMITNFNSLRITVSPTLIGRALIFMNTFIIAIKKRGHRIEKRNHLTYIFIQNEEIEISLREKTTRDKSTANSWATYKPTSALIFSAKAQFLTIKEWQDGKNPIEKKLSSIMTTLEMSGKELKEWRISIEKRREEEKERERIKWKRRQTIEKEFTDFNNLLTQAKRWHEAKLLRDYINHKEDKINTILSGDTNSIFSDELKKWTVWARKKADWYDPNVSAEDELLGVFGTRNNNL